MCLHVVVLLPSSRFVYSHFVLCTGLEASSVKPPKTVFNMTATAMSLRQAESSSRSLHFSIDYQDTIAASLHELSGSPTVPSQQHSDDDSFFGYNSPSSNPGRGGNGESSMSSYLVYEPVVESVSNETWTDWRRYDPPDELLHMPADTSEEIKAIVAPSIIRITRRYREEEEARIAQAKAARPLTRGGRASMKPVRKNVRALDFSQGVEYELTFYSL